MVPLMLTLGGAQLLRDRLERRRDERFARSVEQIADAVGERVAAYEQVLRGGAAFFAVAPDVRREQWHAYVDGLGIEQRYPGIRALGYIPRLPRADIPAFEARLRGEGLDLPVRPVVDTADAFPVLYVEPMEGNRTAIAFDMVRAARRAAAEKARDEGRTVMTSELALVQDPEHASGFLLFAPVYEGNTDHRTLEGRRAGLTGWVYATARARDVIGALPVRVAPELELEVYDGISPRAEALLYDSAPPARAGLGASALSRVMTVTVSGRPWTLRVTTLPPFDAGQPSWEPNVVLAAGGLGSLLVFGFVWSLADARRGAIERAERITGALRASEQRVRSVMDTVADAIITFGRDSKVHSANPAAEWLFGRRLADLIGRDIGDLIPGLVPAPSGHIETKRAGPTTARCR